MTETSGVGAQNGVNGKASYAPKHKLADHFIGGNKLENAPESKVKDFVASHGGHTVITNVSSRMLHLFPSSNPSNPPPPPPPLPLSPGLGSHFVEQLC